jgi:hypothetical protein
VTDQLSLSIWLERGSRANRLRHFEKLLRLFPFSQREEQGQTTVSVQAVSVTEPPLLEAPMNGPIDVSEVLAAVAGYQGDDIAYSVESWWDLWQYEAAEWKLAPARVLIACFGPDFQNGTEREVGEQEDLRIDFGVDSRYLPRPDLTGSGRMTESNIKSMLRLVHELDSALPVAKRKLETESGENFADRLQQALSGSRS